MNTTVKPQPFQDLSWDAAKAAGLKTRTSWNQAGRSLVQDAEPAAMHTGRYGIYDLYDESQTRPKRVSKRPAVPIDLLAAIFTVTRAAKRYRDSAQAYYQYDKHGFARAARQQKEHLYILKDNGLVAAVRAGRVQAVGTHGCLTVYRGEGYCFHSLLRRKGAVLPEVGTDPLTVEAKPKTIHEPRLMDAIHTLEKLEVSAANAVADGEFERFLFPPRRRGESVRDNDYHFDEERSKYDFE